MSKADWNNTDRILYGIMAGGVLIWAVSFFIEACKSKPKVIVVKVKAKAEAVKDPAAQE